MNVSGSYIFEASAERVWGALTDPKVLAGCIPGCDGLEPMGDDEYRAAMTVGVGPVQGRYNAKITMRDKAPYGSYRLVVEGTGAAGFASGEAVITLVEQEGQTTVEVNSDAQVGGTIARVGQRLMGSVAKMMLDQFFNCLRQSIN